MKVATRDSVAGSAVPVYNDGGAICGEVSWMADGCWMQKWGLDPDMHQLQRPPAWATDEAHLALMRDYGARGLRLHTVDGVVWTARLEAFEEFGIPLSRGYGRQVALPLRHWEVRDPSRGRQLGFYSGGAE